MEGESWWPQGIAISSLGDALDLGQLKTKWGTVPCWKVNECLDTDWWLASKKHTWGEFDNVQPTKIELVRNDANVTVMRLDDSHLAMAYAIPTSNRSSALSQQNNLKTAVESTNLLLPTGGMSIGGKDALLLFPCAEFDEASPEWLGESLGVIQSNLAKFSSPNDQKRWNQRLKDIEDQLKPNTLWRAPHTSATVGIPSVRIHPNYTVSVDGKQRALPINQTVSELLLCGTERLPGIAEFIHLEGRLVEQKGYTPEQISVFFEHWKKEVPTSWSSRKALSTVLGGAWIWRYYDVLVVNAESVLYGDESRFESAQKWLKDVSRLQAHLGVLRVWKSGVWVGVATMVVSYYSWQLDSISASTSIGLAMAGALISIGSNLIYWMKDPPAF